MLSGTNYGYSDFMDVVGSEFLTLYDNNLVLWCFFYDENFNFLSSISGKTDDTVAISSDVIVPENAKKMRVNYHIGSIGSKNNYTVMAIRMRINFQYPI